MQKAVRKKELKVVEKRPTDLRSTLDWLRDQGDLLETDKPVNPDLEITGLQKHLDGACPMLFNKVKGKPNLRAVTNLFGDMNVINKMFGWANDVERTRKLAYALSHPIKPQEVMQSVAPCQEHVIENPEDVNEYMLPIRHTTYEFEATVGSGIRCVTGEHFDGGSDLGYNRMNFRWGNVGTYQISPGSHMWQVVNKYYKSNEKIPITMCFGVPPACTLLAGAAFGYAIMPQGCDEIGIAGAIQGSPIRLVKARTVNAMALADAEVVLEGYVDPRDRRFETKEAEDSGQQGVPPLSSGMGRLHGQGLQGADLPRYRRDDAQAGQQADHLPARRAHPRRAQHRHHHPRGDHLRAVQPVAARHRAGRGDPLLHDRLGRLHHPGQEAPPDRRRLAAQFPRRGAVVLAGHAASRSR